MKRRGIGWALVTGFCVIFALGIVWAVLYYGGIQPIQATLTSSYYFDPTTLSFVDTVAAFWMAILTIALVYWWWVESNKRDPYAT